MALSRSNINLEESWEENLFPRSSKMFSKTQLSQIYFFNESAEYY